MTPNTEGLIYVPEIDLHFTEERILLDKNWQTTKDTLKDQEITEIRDPYRAEWLNARFNEREDGMYIISEDALIKGKYKDQEIKLDNCLMLDRCLMRDRYISLDRYLDSITLHGLPPANIPNGNLNYWYPRDSSVAHLNAISRGAGLICCQDPAFSYFGLGVFGARKFSEDSTL